MATYLVAHRSGKEDLAFTLWEPGTSIGRDPRCIIQVPDERVSKQHAVVRKLEGQWVIEDLGSSNGTCVNGQPITEPVGIADGDTISCGPAVFEFIDRLDADSSFVPAHVIDYSSKVEKRTMMEEDPGSA